VYVRGKMSGTSEEGVAVQGEERINPGIDTR